MIRNKLFLADLTLKSKVRISGGVGKDLNDLKGHTGKVMFIHTNTTLPYKYSVELDKLVDGRRFLTSFARKELERI